MLKTNPADIRALARLVTLLGMAWLAAPAAQAAGLIVPADLLPGDQYRLLFVTSTTRFANSSTIANYNDFVSAAASSQADFASLGATWKAVASTNTVDARDNTNTNPSGGGGVPIYRADGRRLAHGNTDLWDGQLFWIPNITEVGTTNPFIRVWTGTQSDGTEFIGQPLGSSDPRTGRSDTASSFWVNWSSDSNISGNPLYGMSDVRTVTSLGAYVRFETVVTSASGELAGEFPPTRPVTITYELDEGIADANADPGAGVYPGAMLRLTVYLTHPFQSLPVVPFEGGTVQTFDNTANPDDQVSITGNSNPSGATIGGIVPQSAEVGFIGSTAMLSGDGLPVTVPTNVQSLTLTLQSATGSTFVQLSANVTPILPVPDTDGDGVPDTADNCTLVANPTQLEADDDGYGNLCDADLNNSGLTTATDFNLLRSVLNQASTASPLAAAADMNGSGLVTATDFNLLRARLNTAPGPSGLACAGTIPCPPILMYVVAGNSTEFIPRRDACGSSAGRTCESLIGNAITDALRSTYPVDFAITNSGGIRANLTCPTSDDPSDFCPFYTPPPYPITRGQVLSVLPFGNKVVTVTITGAELKTMLENGVSLMPSESGRFPQVSGLCFTYDIGAPVNSRVTGVVRQVWDGSCTGGAVDLTAGATYLIAENDFMATGGDGYQNFAGRTTVQGVMDQVVTDWISATTPLNPSIQGRIVCTTGGLPACPVILP